MARPEAIAVLYQAYAPLAKQALSFSVYVCG